MSKPSTCCNMVTRRGVHLLALAIGLTWLAGPLMTSSWAHPVDVRRTSHGGPQPFSLRHLEPPPPSIYDDKPITDDVSMAAWRFSEPGLHPLTGDPLGLLLYQGHGGSRAQWVIYDMLAWTPVRHLLYEEPGPWLAAAGQSDAPAEQRAGRPVHAQPPSPEPDGQRVVPLPTTAVLMIAGVMMILPRRPNRARHRLGPTARVSTKPQDSLAV